MVDDLIAGICKNCLWSENKGSIVIADLDVNDLSRDSRSKDEADEWNEHGWQVRMRVGQLKKFREGSRSRAES